MAADRVLEVLPAHRGEHHGDAGGEHEGEQQPVLDPAGREEGDDGHVPEVDAVGPLAEPAHRQATEDRRPHAGGAQHREDRAHRGDTEQGDAALVEEHVVLVDEDDHREDAGDADQSEDRGGGPVGLCRLPGGTAGGQPDGQRGAEQQPTGTGVGALVGAGVVRTGAREPPHQSEGRHGEDHRRPGHQRPAPAQQEQQSEQEQRPDQVELLLHRQGPHVVQGAGATEVVEVGGLGEDRVPVVDVEERRESFTGPVGQCAAVEGDGEQEDGDDRDDHRRGQTPEPA